MTGTATTGGQQAQIATVKYNAAGVQQWVALGAAAVGNKASALVVNGGNVVVTGQSNLSGEYDALTVAYDRASGAEQWSSRIAGSGHFGDAGNAITRDAQGNLYIAGWIWDASNGLLIAKYDSAGALQWSRNYQPYANISGSNAAYAIARDPTGGVVAVGRAIGVSGFDYAVVKYDDAGNRQWSQLYNGPPGTLDDQAGTVAVRDDGVVVAAGTEAYTNGSGTTDRRTTLFIVDGVQATTPHIAIATSVAGQPYAVNVSVRGKVGFPAGSVLVTDSDGHSCGIALANGDGACTLSNATAGGKIVNAAFSPDTPALFAASQGSTTHTVDKATTRLTLTTPGLTRPGDAFDAEVDFGVVAPGAGTPSGNITVGDGVDSCTVTPPATRCTLTLNTPGARTVSAHYAGDANYLAVTATAAHRVNRAPVANGDGYALAEDGSLAIDAAAGVLANDSDGDADPLSVTPGTFQADGIGGTVVLRADGSFDYTPPADANGTATFAYTAGDGAETASGNVNITVRAVNDPPSIAIGANRTHGAATTGMQTVAAFVTTVSMGPADEAGQSLAAVLAQVDSDPDGVLDSIAVDTSGNLTYALTGHGGTATVSVRARDNGGTTDNGSDTSAPHMFTITVASGVDLAVTVDNGQQFVVGGSAVHYTVEARNFGPDTARAARLAVGQPLHTIAFTWTCTRSDAAPCPEASGEGLMSQLLEVPVGVVVTVRVTTNVLPAPEMPVTLDAVINPTGASGQTDVQPSNNSAHDTDPVGIFADGFDD